jgi:hypothetical protein
MPSLADHAAVTVGDRCVPLVTAAYGTRVARPTRTTILTTWRQRLQLVGRMRPVRGDHCIVGKSREGSRQPGRGTRLRPLLIAQNYRQNS